MQPSSSFQYQTFPPMPVSGIQGQVLEVTVVGCNKLKDTEWISRQDPYVCLEYGSTKFRTRTCTDGGKNPIFQEKFVFTLIEGLQELNAVVWNSNTLTFDDYIGNGKIQLHKVLNHGYDDSPWPLQTKTGRYSGEIRLILHYSNAAANKMTASYTPSPPPPPQQYMTPHVPLYASPPPVAGGPYYSAAAYPNPSPYPTSYLTNPASYQPPAYHLQPSAYSSQPYPPTAYLPQPYPPPPQPTSYYPPGPYMGSYPPPPPPY